MGDFPTSSRQALWNPYNNNNRTRRRAPRTEPREWSEKDQIRWFYTGKEPRWEHPTRPEHKWPEKERVGAPLEGYDIRRQSDIAYNAPVAYHDIKYGHEVDLDEKPLWQRMREYFDPFEKLESKDRHKLETIADSEYYPNPDEIPQFYRSTVPTAAQRHVAGIDQQTDHLPVDEFDPIRGATKIIGTNDGWWVYGDDAGKSALMAYFYWLIRMWAFGWLIGGIRGALKARKIWRSIPGWEVRANRDRRLRWDLLKMKVIRRMYKRSRQYFWWSNGLFFTHMAISQVNPYEAQTNWFFTMTLVGGLIGAKKGYRGSARWATYFGLISGATLLARNAARSHNGIGFWIQRNPLYQKIKEMNPIYKFQLK